MTSAPAIPHLPAAKSVAQGLWRGAKGRCPECGEGRIFRKYLKVQACEVCGNDNARYPTDDLPPYVTILLIGHLVVAPLLFFPWIWQANTLLVLSIVMPALLLLILAFLPVVKGAAVGLHWAIEPRHEIEEA
jgi:uncharacterized protein (DUF983 family)